MCTTVAPIVADAIETRQATGGEPGQAEAFANRMVEMLHGASTVLMTSVGHRTGLFDVMSALPGPATSDDIAIAAQLSERYVREWLGAMVVGGIVEYEARTRTYRLPPAHAACLTRAASPGNLAVSAQWIPLLGGVEDEVVRAFEHGRGVPYSAYTDFHRVMAEESAQTVVAALHEHILPLVPGLTDRLSDGIDVLDIACGSGRAMIELAGAFPNSRFSGYDVSDDAIGAARAEARRRGVTNVRFEVRDVAEAFEHRAFDLVTAFDAIHDQAKPDRVLANIRAALRPGGTYLMQDILASTHVHQNVGHPLGPFIYAVSVMHCMSVSLANGGPGLGAAWGKEKALEMLEDAGFDDVIVRTLPHDPLNYYYIVGGGEG
jgi:ubiquinone/menaquinone biosynthesis C-methylase UbiE